MTDREPYFPYRLEERSARPVLGLIVLQVDETIEQDFRRLFSPENATLHFTRIPSGADLTPDTIAGMEYALPTAAALLPPSLALDVIGYACTSATTLLGPERVKELVLEGARARQVTNPFTAALASFEKLGAEQIAIVSPYIAEVSVPLAKAFGNSGIRVSASLSFGERTEEKVARITPASIGEAALEIGRRSDVQAVFLSCTNLRTLDVIDEIENALGKPVVSSNQALAWHMATLADARLAADAPGMLMKA